MLLGSCTSGGGGGSSEVGITAGSLNGTWKINRVVSGGSCSFALNPDSVYVTLETNGTTVTVQDAEDPTDPGLTLPLSGRSFETVSGGDRTNITIGSDGVTLTGSDVETYPSGGSTCTVNRSLSGVRLSLPSNVPTGDWTFTLVYNAGAGNITQSLGSVTLAQKYTSLSGQNSSAVLAGIVQSSGSWEGVGGFGAAIDITRFNGNFTGGTSFAGSWSGRVGVTTVSGDITGTKNTGGGGGSCATVGSGIWNLNLNGGPFGPLAFPDCVVTQTACTLTFAFSSGGQTATFSGPLTGSNWSATTTGNLFSSLGLTVTLAGTLSGTPVNTLTGTWNFSGSATGSGTLSATKN